MAVKLTLKISLFATAVVAVALFGVTPLQAGLLDYSANAYNDGHGPGAGGAWYGTATYSDLSLSGSVEWVVFAPDAFSLVLGGHGYTPSAHELVYAFEVDNAGTSDVSTLDAGMVAGRPRDNVGSFTIPSQTGVSPATSSFSGTTPFDTAHWFFGNPSVPILTGQSSTGLAYASINTPELSLGSVINSGLSGNFSLPGPSTIPATVPEPSTLAVVTLAVTIVALGRRHGRRSKQHRHTT
jgi:hypothetical protein